ncbi:MAG: histidine kinase [Arcobacter sp.]|nr:MAG: histidine kinase [Arcobacter sp.]
MSLKKVEFESLGKSFALFFLSLTFLMSLILYNNYLLEKDDLDENLFTQMRLCSFDLKCTQFEFDFIEAKNKQVYTLYKDEQGPYAFFSIPKDSSYLLKLSYPLQDYVNERKSILNTYLYKFLLSLLVLALISMFFSWYTLRPLRQALTHSDEFIKDILHDFNTPLSTLRLNSSLLSNTFKDNKKIGRIEQAVQMILNLQNNLRSYIDESPLQSELIDLKKLLQERVHYFSDNYPDLSFTTELDPMSVKANIDALTRILDNLISNACKYNKKGGYILLRLDASQNILSIKDTGRGIKEPKKIFERFYKEHDRGLGIGLHIVQKLCKALKIPINVQSQLAKGSIFTLDLKEIREED